MDSIRRAAPIAWPSFSQKPGVSVERHDTPRVQSIPARRVEEARGAPVLGLRQGLAPLLGARPLPTRPAPPQDPGHTSTIEVLVNEQDQPEFGILADVLKQFLARDQYSLRTTLLSPYDYARQVKDGRFEVAYSRFGGALPPYAATWRCCSATVRVTALDTTDWIPY